MQKIVDGIRQFQNDAFVKDQQLFKSLVDGQHPEALMVTCSDSRIDPNLITQTKPGELFVQRTAGNIVPTYEDGMGGGEAATIEYAVAALKVKNIIICGHSHCGAMGGLLNLDAVEQLPAVKAYLGLAEPTKRIVDENYGHVTDAAERLAFTVEANVLVQIENLRTHPSVAAALDSGELELHGWVYDFETGDITSFDREQGRFSPI
jgi:carbonic anhydrase